MTAERAKGSSFADRQTLGCLLLICSCFTLTSEAYIAWLYHLMELSSPTGADWYGLVVSYEDGHAPVRLGHHAPPLLCASRRRGYHRCCDVRIRRPHGRRLRCVAGLLPNQTRIVGAASLAGLNPRYGLCLLYGPHLDAVARARGSGWWSALEPRRLRGPFASCDDARALPPARNR